MKFVILKENEKKNKLLEQLRNTKFENYAKIMQELDMELVITTKFRLKFTLSSTYFCSK